MIRRRSTRSSRHGGVLIATLILVMTVAVLSVCVLQLDSARLKRQVASIDNKRAFNLAEAGLSEGVFGVRLGRSGTIGSQTQPAKYGDGLFWVETTKLGGDLVGLESTGMAGSGRVTLGLVVRREAQTVGSLGLVGAASVTLESGARIDAYDSGEDPAESQLGPGGVDLVHSAPLRSNGEIVIGDDALIEGNATPGPESSVSLGQQAVVTGSTAPSSSTSDLPPIQVPAIEESTDIAHSEANDLVLESGDSAYDTLSIASGAKVVLRGPATVVIANLIVDGGGELAIDSGSGPVRLYVTNWLKLKSSSQLSFATTDPLGFSLLVSASGVRDRDGDGLKDAAVTFLPTGPFYGSLYVPAARVNLSDGFELFGTVAADRLTLGVGAQVHFDQALEASDGSNDAVEVLSWRIVEVPVQVAKDLRVDPFEALNVDPATAKTPADSYPVGETWIKVTYIEVGTLTQKTYRGPEVDFDWNTVKAVVDCIRKVL